MTGTLLDFLAASGAENLHAQGSDGSRVLFQALGLGADDRVLEIGCGTGASLVRAGQEGAAQIVGSEVAHAMVSQARDRVAYCGFSSRVEVVHHDPGARLRFDPGSFTAIYGEGVFASLNRTVLTPLLKDAWRCLAPQGRFAAIELFYRPSTDHDTALGIETRYRTTFGDDFVQAETGRADAIAALLADVGFSQVQVQDADPLIAALPADADSDLILRSAQFSRSRGAGLKFTPAYWIKRMRFRRAFRDFAPEFSYLHPVLVTARR